MSKPAKVASPSTSPLSSQPPLASARKKARVACRLGEAPPPLSAPPCSVAPPLLSPSLCPPLSPSRPPSRSLCPSAPADPAQPSIPGSLPVTWADNGSSSVGGMKLSKTEKVNGPIRLSYEQVMSNVEAWGGYCIVAYIVGSYPGHRAVDSVRTSWGVDNKVYHHHDSGWMVFKFQNCADREKVLSSGPYCSFGRPWVLRSMPDFFIFDDEPSKVNAGLLPI